MIWDEYYEKINYWAVSTAESKISSLEDMGTADEVADALYIFALDNKKGATRLLNKALQYGIKFSGENLVEISGICGEESFRKALAQSADSLTAQDLEDMYGCVDDRLIIEVAKKYHITVPKDIADEYEEELCQDVTVPISWSRFYSAFYGWSEEYACARSGALSDFGKEDEVIRVANELFGSNEQEASQFIQRAVCSGVKFGEDNLLEISSLCDSKTTNQAVIASGSKLNANSLETLYGEVEDKVLIQVARLHNIRLPKEIRREFQAAAAEAAAFQYQVHCAMAYADCALECLYQALDAMNTGSNYSVIDMLSNSFFPSFLKYAALEDAEQKIAIAQEALVNMNIQLSALLRNRSVQLQTSKLSSVVDLWLNSGTLDCLVHMRINKVRKRIKRTISQVEGIKRELKRLSR